MIEDNRIILDDNEIQWVKENMILSLDQETLATFTPKTIITLFDKTYSFNGTEEYTKSIFKALERKYSNEFQEALLSDLLIQISFKPPQQLLRIRKLKRIIYGENIDKRKKKKELITNDDEILLIKMMLGRKDDE